MATTIANDIQVGTLQTTNATPGNVVTVAIPTSSVMLLNVFITGRQGTVTAAVGYELVGVYKNSAGTVTLIGAVATPLTAEDAGLAACAVALVISGTNVLVQVTGIAATTIEWNATVYIVKNV